MWYIVKHDEVIQIYHEAKHKIFYINKLINMMWNMLNTIKNIYTKHFQIYFS